VQGLRWPKNGSLPGVNDQFSDKHNAAIGVFAQPLFNDYQVEWRLEKIKLNEFSGKLFSFERLVFIPELKKINYISLMELI